MPQIGKTMKQQKSEIPITRIRNVLKNNCQISRFSRKSTELISELTATFIRNFALKSSMYLDGCKKKTLSLDMIFELILSDEMYDFLVDIIPDEYLEKVFKVQCEEINNFSENSRYK